MTPTSLQVGTCEACLRTSVLASVLHGRSGAALGCLQFIGVLSGSAWRSAEELRELRKREKEQGIHSNWEIDSFMAADTLEGKREAIVTEYMLRILGLDVSRSEVSCQKP